MQQLGRMDRAHVDDIESLRQQLLDAITDIHTTYIRMPDPQAAFQKALHAYLDLTKSEYGFIGEVHVDSDGNPWLKTFALSNIAWDDESQALYEKYWHDGFEFRNLKNLFGPVLTRGELVISNAPEIDPRSGGVPLGHPKVRSFVGIPFHVDGQLVGMVGLANREEGYSGDLVEGLHPLSTVCGTMIASLVLRRERDRANALLTAAEQSQLEVAERNAALVRAHPDYMFVLDAAGRFLDYHCGDETALYVPASVFLGHTIEEVLPPQICELYRHGTAEALRTGQPAEMQYSLEIAGQLRKFDARVMTFPRNQFLLISRDITEKAAAEEERQRTESRLKLVIQKLPAIVWTVDTELCITTVVGRTLETFHIDPTVLIGMPVSECVRMLGLDPALENAQQRALDGEAVNYDFQFLDSELHCYVEPQRDPAGKIVGAIGVALDRTKFVRIENELREKNRFVDRIAEASPHIIYVFDLHERRTIYCNRQVAADLGYSPEQVVAMGDEFMFHLLHPDDRLHLQQLFHRWDSARDDEIIATEYRLQHADGSLRWFMGRDTVFSRDERGAVRQIIGTAQDITDRVLAEHSLQASREQLQAIFNADPACLKVIAPDGTLLAINASGLQMLGLESDQQVLGKSLLTNVAPEHRESYAKTHQQVCSGHPADLIFQFVGANGERRWMELHGVPLRYTVNGPTMNLAITRDITEELLARQTIAEQQAQLTHFSRLATMGQMLAAISHEITQPLSAISNYAAASSLAAERSPQVDPRLHQFLKSITIQAERAGDILERLRGFLRRSDALQNNADLRIIVQDSIELIRFQMQKRQVRVELRTDPTPVQVAADIVQIQQVMVNLLTNACDAMIDVPVEQRLIEVSCFRHLQLACVAVSDHGPGISDEQHAKLFQAFATTKVTGMGLGLAICRDILRIHRGVIVGANRPEGGATFEFRLPIADGGAA